MREETTTAKAGTDAATTGNALILEGGGYRGQFTAGVLDVLMEHGIYGFDSVWGVSAGALNAMHFRARQIGRGVRVVQAFRDDNRMMSVASFLKTGNIAGNDFLYREVQDEIDPMDVETFNASPMRMWAVAADVDTGEPAYLEIRRLPDDIDRVIASASLPVVSNMVELDGHRYLDGGFGCSIPVGAALGVDDAAVPEGHMPAERALVVLTRERSYVRTSSYSLMGLAERRYADYPQFLEAMHDRAARYTHEQVLVSRLEQEGRALVIAPPGPVNISTTERNGEKLLRLYVEGRQEALAHLEQIEAFLRG